LCSRCKKIQLSFAAVRSSRPKSKAGQKHQLRNGPSIFSDI
jgi:hypothetical protein